MSIFDYFRPKSNSSASLAKERLQIIVAHQRGRRVDFLPLLQKELLSVIAKYVHIDPDQVKIDLDRHGDTSVLELNVILPNSTPSPNNLSDPNDPNDTKHFNKTSQAQNIFETTD